MVDFVRVDLSQFVVQHPFECGEVQPLCLNGIIDPSLSQGMGDTQMDVIVGGTGTGGGRNLLEQLYDLAPDLSCGVHQMFEAA